MSKICYLYFFFLLLSACAVDKRIDHRELIITNRSNKNIYYFYSQNDSVFSDAIDYNITWNKYMETNLILTNDTSSLMIEGKWEKYLSECPQGKFRLFFIDRNLVEKYGWQNIVKRNIYSKKILMNLSDLMRINWFLVYK